MPSSATFEHNGRTFKITTFMTWEEVERAESFFTPAQENISELIASAVSMEDKLKVATELRKSSKEQRAFVKQMLTERAGLKEEELKKMQFIDALLIYNKYFTLCNDITPFLERPSAPASSSDST